MSETETVAGKPGARDAAGAPAVTRAVALLRLLGRSAEPLGVNAIARELGLVPSSCLHILRALAAESLITVDPETKRYSLDAGILALANRLLRRDDFSRRATPHLEEIAARFRVTCVAVRIMGLRHQVVLALARADAPFQLQVDAGSQFPALITASGYCCAAFGGHSRAVLREAFSRLDWEDPPSFEVWMDGVAATRRNGYAVDSGRYIRGADLVAAPVFRAGGTISHALVSVGLSAQSDPERTVALGRALIAAADALSFASMGG